MSSQDQKKPVTNAATDEKDKNKKKSKKKKPQGPIRFEAIVPISIIIGAIVAYSVLFLDSHLRMGLQAGLSYAYRAEVNIAALRLSFTEPSMTIDGIEFTDKVQPTKNAFEFGKIRFALVWDSLLRAKIVIKESSIKGLGVQTIRKKPGYVLPPEPPKAETGPSLTAQLTEKLQKEAEAQLQGNVFGDLLNISKGGDINAQLEAMKDELQSEKKLKEIEASLKQKQDEWKKRFDALPKADEIKAIAADIKSTKIDASNPVEAKSKIEGLQAQLKKASGIVEAYDKGQNELKSDLGGFDRIVADIEASVEKDIADLQSKLKIPEVNTEAMSKALFTKLMGDKLTQITPYLDMARKYMPAKSEKKETDPQFVPHARGSGRTYRFPVTVSYPMFWWQHAEISSSAEGNLGEFSGILRDITNDMAATKKPMNLELSGNTETIKGIKLAASMDLQRSVMELDVASHPFPAQEFTKSSDITLGLGEANARAKVVASLEGDQLRAEISEVISGPKFVTDAKQPMLKEALAAVTNNIKTLDMVVGLSGTWDNPDFKLRSNLGEELAKGFKAHLNQKLAEVKQKLKAYVEGRIKGEKDKLKAQFDQIKTQYLKQLDEKKADLLAKKGDAENSLKSKAKESQNKATDQLKDKAKDALKKFKF